MAFSKSLAASGRDMLRMAGHYDPPYAC